MCEGFQEDEGDHTFFPGTVLIDFLIPRWLIGTISFTYKTALVQTIVSSLHM